MSMALKPAHDGPPRAGVLSRGAPCGLSGSFLFFARFTTHREVGLLDAREVSLAGCGGLSRLSDRLCGISRAARSMIRCLLHLELRWRGIMARKSGISSIALAACAAGLLTLSAATAQQSAATAQGSDTNDGGSRL